MRRNSRCTELLTWLVNTSLQCASCPHFRKCQKCVMYTLISHFLKLKLCVMKSAWLLPCESTCTVREWKNAVLGVHTTTCSTDACPGSHSLSAYYRLWIKWIKPFLLLVTLRCFHPYITHCEALPFCIISTPAENYFCNYQMLQIPFDI